MSQPQPPRNPLRLGTRRSLLAQAQSSWVARQLESLHPGLRVQLVGVETRGDQLLDVPLSTAQGREFFVAELDAALLAGEVDFTVHSHKDLSLDRPTQLTLAATPRRADPRDVILFGPSASQRLASRSPLRIGTGSPRRIANLSDFLPAALPGASPQPTPEFIPIRGNIDTRLSRIHLPPSHDRHIDAVVLALAGLSRVITSPDGLARLQPLLRDVRWMILPLRECPTAPAQGALAIECRASDPDIHRCLASLHHPPTALHVAREREILAAWGGGCHLALGATSFDSPNHGAFLHVRGRKPDGTPIAETHTTPSTTPSTSPVPSTPPAPFTFIPNPAPEGPTPEPLPNQRLWTADLDGWHTLARRNLWVEGCAEGLGPAFIQPLLAEPILQGLPTLPATQAHPPS